MPKTATTEGILIPADSLKAVFGPDTFAKLAAVTQKNESVRSRLEVLTASGPAPQDQDARLHVRYLRAQKAAWATYLDAAFASGMLNGDRGTELRARLTGTDEDGFRSAMAECLACWFLAGRLGFPLVGEAPGRGSKNLDMRIAFPDGECGVEVKAPFRAPPPPNPISHATVWCGDDTDKIAQCLESANKQFGRDGPNLLVIVPSLRTSMCDARHELVRAAYGETVIALDVNVAEGRLENPRPEFSPRGKFLNSAKPDGRLLKSDGLPAYRRASAILCIEPFLREKYPNPMAALVAGSVANRDRGDLARIYEKQRDQYWSRDNEVWMDHNALVLHNPVAYHPLADDIWLEYPQLLIRNGEMVWTDGYDRFV